MGSGEFVRRYGLAIAVVLGLATVVALLPGNVRPEAANSSDLGLASGGDGQTASGADGDGSVAAAAGDGSPSGAAATGGPGTGSGRGGGPSTAGASSGRGTAAAAGASSDVRLGEGPCRPDGRQAGVSIYMPPCLRWTGTDNGGSTFRGVTRDKVVVVRYLSQLDQGTQAILQGARLADDPAVIRRAFQTLTRYGNLHYETYGREVVLVDYSASGPSESEEAMRADALRIARDIKPFAVIDGNPAAPVPTVLARELSQLGVICLCTTSLSSAFYRETPLVLPYSLPTVDEYAVHTAEYIAKKLAGRPATYAGDELNPSQQMRTKERKFGLIHVEGARGKVDPELRRGRDAMLREFARRGLKFAATVGYIYDPGRNQQDVSNLVATLKGAGVTTIVPLWEPFYPILITDEATRQQYFPEWFVVGTGLSDTTTGGRLYNQLQWRHAFGISPLWVTWATVPASPGYREYHHAAPGSPRGDEGVLVNIYRVRVQTLFRGIHLAGPRLTNETFVRGLLSYPRTGGKPGAPLVFLTKEHPTDIKDFIEVWWDPNRRGPDEREEQGSGMMMRADGGRRYVAGQWTTAPSKAFVAEGAVTVDDNPPGGGDPPHEQDRHTHSPQQRCLSCR